MLKGWIGMIFGNWPLRCSSMFMKHNSIKVGKMLQWNFLEFIELFLLWCGSGTRRLCPMTILLKVFYLHHFRRRKSEEDFDAWRLWKWTTTIEITEGADLCIRSNCVGHLHHLFIVDIYFINSAVSSVTFIYFRLRRSWFFAHIDFVDSSILCFEYFPMFICFDRNLSC